jgi:ribosomal protein S18 acetylase RimI-like enzyme
VSAIYLLRHAQRQGTGRALITRLFSFMAARGMRSAGLWVLHENTAARAFYQRLGTMEEIARRQEIADMQVIEIACRWTPIPHRPFARGASATI